MMNVNEAYAFVRRLKAAAQKHGRTELVEQLDDALHLGSSGLEILGAIRNIVADNREIIFTLMGPSSQSEVEEIITFADKMYGH